MSQCIAVLLAIKANTKAENDEVIALIRKAMRKFPSDKQIQDVGAQHPYIHLISNQYSVLKSQRELQQFRYLEIFNISIAVSSVD